MIAKFGTDGIRGKYGDKVTDEIAFLIGNSLAKICNEENINQVYIGKDPRESSDILEEKVMEGLILGGVNVIKLGVVPTPIISFSICEDEVKSFGVMISASHNPYYDNGIKLFGTNGKKILDTYEQKIEKNIKSKEIFQSEDGHSSKGDEQIKNYVKFLSLILPDLSGVRVALDCSNGSGYQIAPKIFLEKNAELITIGINPDGKNINEGIGSTHPEAIQKLISENEVDIGFAYDGDADRIILFDGNGKVYDGDAIIYLLACKLKDENKLLNNKVAITQMSNIGLKKALDIKEIEYIETLVGDKYVMQEIDKSNLSLGGEQSGHIILSDLITTGDGILSSVYLLNMFVKDKKLFETLNQEFKQYPQVLKNIKTEHAKELLEKQEVIDILREEEEKLNGNGRILLRASGTEPLLRIMVESETLEKCEQIAMKIAIIIEKNGR